MTRAACVVGLALTVSGCAYYNAMWTAERFAKDARRLEASGREPEARTQWARAAVKAESVLARALESTAATLWLAGSSVATACCAASLTC